MPARSFGFPRKASEGEYLRCSSQTRQVTRGMERIRSRNSAQRIEILTGHGFEFVIAPLGFMLDSRIQRRLFRRVGPVRTNGNSADGKCSDEELSGLSPPSRCQFFHGFTNPPGQDGNCEPCQPCDGKDSRTGVTGQEAPSQYCECNQPQSPHRGPNCIDACGGSAS